MRATPLARRAALVYQQQLQPDLSPPARFPSLSLSIFAPGTACLGISAVNSPTCGKAPAPAFEPWQVARR